VCSRKIRRNTDGPSGRSTVDSAGPGAPKRSTAWIRSLRGPKPHLDPWQPAGAEVEWERDRDGEVVPVGTAFLTNRECPFTCLMCDLWQYTTDESVPAGAVDRQVEAALVQLPDVRQLKLYNAGNFFDDRAIAPGDRDAIARRLGALDVAVLENHPKLVDERVRRFRDDAGTAIDVAMGLETAHTEVLRRLNKGMTLDDFSVAAERLLSWDVQVRAFILLRPPWLSEAEGLDWACRTLDFAWSVGVECCSIIPTRPGNGALDVLAQEGHFTPPSLRSLEAAVEYGVSRGRGRVFGDLWDIERFVGCARCSADRVERIRTMNLQQSVPPALTCDCETTGASA